MLKSIHFKVMKTLVLWLALATVLVSPCIEGQPASFRFAWLTDTHVGSPTAADDLRSAVHDINSIDDLAFTILSGDITELGKNSELESAKAILDSLRKPYHIIPGNHDTKWSESGCTKFAKLWGSDKFVFEYGGYQFIGLHEGPIMRMGDGHFAPEDLRWLDSVLAHIPNKRQPLLLVTHYPLDPGIDNWYEVIQRLKRFNIRVALVGHGHANSVFSFEGIPGVMGRSNLRARRPQGGYTIVRVLPDTVQFFERTPEVKATSAWHTVAFSTQSSLADTARFSRPDFSINRSYPTVRARWKFETGYTIASSAAVWKDRAVVGSRTGNVQCISLDTGAEEWSFATGSAVYSTPDVADGRAVFGSTDGNIYCLNVGDGKLLWKVSTLAPIVAAPTISQGTVFIGGGDSKFRAIDLASGSRTWEYDGIGAFVETKPVVYQGKVVFGSWDTYLYALNVTDGSLAWKWSNGNPTLHLSPAACWPVAADGKVFVVAPDRVMSAIDVQEGKTVWRSAAHQVREAIGISEDRTRIFAKCMNDTLFSFSPFSTTPLLLWATHCGYGYDIDPSMPIEKNGVVYFGTKNGMVYALDSKTGRVLWQYRVGVTIVNTVSPIDDKRVIVTDADGKVILLESK